MSGGRHLTLSLIHISFQHILDGLAVVEPCERIRIRLADQALFLHFNGMDVCELTDQADTLSLFIGSPQRVYVNFKPLLLSVLGDQGKFNLTAGRCV